MNHGSSRVLESSSSSIESSSLSNTSDQTSASTVLADDDCSSKSETGSDFRWYFVLPEHPRQGEVALVPDSDGFSEIHKAMCAFGSRIDSDLNTSGLTTSSTVLLKCTNKASDPVAVDAQNRMLIQWDIPKPPQRSQSIGRFEITLGLSCESLDLDSVHQLLIKIGSVDPYVEVVTKRSLKSMNFGCDNLIRLRIHTLVDFGSLLGDNITSVATGLELRMLSNAPTTNGRLFIHYIELHNIQAEIRPLDSTHVHEPYIWSLDVGGVQGKTIRVFALSGDGQYLATLSDHMELGTQLTSLELWEIDTLYKCYPGNQSTMAAARKRAPEALASEILAPTFAYDESNHHLSVSCDGSQVSISSSKCGESLAVYLHFKDKQRLQQSENHGVIVGTKGHGRFSDTTTIFVSVEDACAKICHAPNDKPWNSLRTIPFDSCLLDHSISDRYIALLFQDRLLVWNMKVGRLISFLERATGKGDHVSFGEDHSLLFLTEGGFITSVLSDWGTVLSSRSLQVGSSPSLLAPVQGHGKQVIIPRIQDVSGDHHGIALSPVNLAKRYMFFTLPHLTLLSSRPSPEEDLQALTFHGSKIDLVRLQDRVIDFAGECGKTCASGSQEPLPHTRRDHLTMDARMDTHLHKVVLTVSDATGVLNTHNILLPRSWPLTKLRTKILPRGSKLVLTMDALIMVWSLPVAVEKPLTLDLAWCLDAPSAKGTLVKECKHGELYLEDEDPGTDLRILKDLVDLTSMPEAVAVMQHLAELFHITDPWCKDDIIRYLGQFLNSTAHIIVRICQAWTDHDRLKYERLARSILESSQTRWVPVPVEDEHNPGLIILERSRTSPGILGLFRYIIDYCVDKATVECDTLFLWPITSCFGVWTDRRFPHHDLAARVIRRLAFIPAPGRNFIIDRHAIARPPELRKSHDRPLHKYKNPILQLERSSKRWKNANRQDERFTRDLFVASFDMIWEKQSHLVPQALETGPAATASVLAVLPGLSAARGLIKAINFATEHGWIKALKRNRDLKTYDFTLEDLDNPALAALIEYKWNTIGFKFWCIRFCVRCVYYGIVLASVFHQIYGYQATLQDDYYELQTASGLIVLYSELFRLVTLILGKKAVTLFTLVDIMVALSPLLQYLSFWIKTDSDSVPGVFPGGLKDPTISNYSFIVPLIALQLLFELRVNKAMCKFVTIIVRIFIDVRVFFVIFLIGNLAFTTAILHMIRGCWPPGWCPDPATTFPSNFFMALTSTAGRFDPISVEFGGEDCDDQCCVQHGGYDLEACLAKDSTRLY
ncbi:hypothetical protein BGZ90_009057 [Linnemannia elongata]|nr:hypothetical protein BGZ90_009057 [Linnemannia elongata]